MNNISNKIAFLGDTHFGVKNDNAVFLEHQMKFFEEKFFPWVLENGIKHVIQFGDLMDKRKSVNFVTLATIQKRFFQWFDDNDIQLHVLLGNHDVYYKSTNKINSVEALFSMTNIKIYSEATNVNFGSTQVLIIPWITQDNCEDIFNAINETSAKYCFGHLEFQGFEFAKGIMSYHGTNHEPFQKFKHVWTGHYHTSSTKDNITYLGTPYEMTWSDYNDQKKVYAFDTETEKLESTVLNERMFVYIDWCEELALEWLQNGSIDVQSRYNASKGATFRVTVPDPKYDMQVDNFVKWLDKAFEATKISVIDIYNIVSEEVDIENIRVKSTLDLLYESVSSLPRSEDLQIMAKETYEKALIMRARPE